VHNFHPERWPAGNPETDFGNCDPGPTKELLKAIGGQYYELSFGKRLPDELYDLRRDPAGVNNLANDLYHAGTVEAMRARMLALLKEDQDPRVLGQAAVLESYEYVGGGGNKSYENWLKTQEQKLSGAAAASAPAEPVKKGRKK
jgi:N-sulfoglucosamine sulfohydrolase